MSTINTSTNIIDITIIKAPKNTSLGEIEDKIDVIDASVNSNLFTKYKSNGERLKYVYNEFDKVYAPGMYIYQYDSDEDKMSYVYDKEQSADKLKEWIAERFNYALEKYPDLNVGYTKEEIDSSVTSRIDTLFLPSLNGSKEFTDELKAEFNDWYYGIMCGYNTVNPDKTFVHARVGLERVENADGTYSYVENTNWDTTSWSKPLGYWNKLLKPSYLELSESNQFLVLKDEQTVTDASINKRIDELDASIDNNYYSKTEIDNKGFVTDAVTSTMLDSSLANYYTKKQIDDKGYLTEHQSLAGYATESFVTSQGYITSIPSEYVTDSELTAKGYLTSVPSEYVTDSELTAKGYLTSVPSEYVTDSELTAKGYLTSVPSEYVTDSELTAKGYLTSVPSEYVTDSELTTKGYVAGTGITSIVKLTQTLYDALTTKDSNTLYIVSE